MLSIEICDLLLPSPKHRRKIPRIFNTSALCALDCFCFCSCAQDRFSHCSFALNLKFRAAEISNNRIFAAEIHIDSISASENHCTIIVTVPNCYPQKLWLLLNTLSSSIFLQLSYIICKVSKSCKWYF